MPISSSVSEVIGNKEAFTETPGKCRIAELVDVALSPLANVTVNGTCFIRSRLCLLLFSCNKTFELPESIKALFLLLVWGGRPLISLLAVKIKSGLSL
jgi:hypothetical protein